MSLTCASATRHAENRAPISGTGTDEWRGADCPRVERAPVPALCSARRRLYRSSIRHRFLNGPTRITAGQSDKVTFGRPKIDVNRICMDNSLLCAQRIHASASSLALMSHSRCVGNIEAHAFDLRPSSPNCGAAKNVPAPQWQRRWRCRARARMPEMRVRPCRWVENPTG